MLSACAAMMAMFEMLVVVKTMRKYGVYFMADDSLEQFISRSSFEDVLRVRIAVHGFIWMLSIAGILAYLP